MSTRILLPPPFRRPAVIRTATLWLFLRGVSTSGAVELTGLPLADALRPGVLSYLWMAAFVSGAVWIDMVRRDETVFLANLGISSGHALAFVGAQSLVMDFILRLIIG